MDECPHGAAEARNAMPGQHANGYSVDRPHRRSPFLREAGDLAGPAAGRDDDRSGGEGIAYLQRHTLHPQSVVRSRSYVHPDHSIGHRRHPVDPAGLEQGCDYGPVIDLAVVGQVHPSADSWRQHRLGLSAGLGPEADGREADGLMEAEHPVNGHAVGRIAGHKQCAVRSEVDGHTGRGLQLGGKAGPAAAPTRLSAASASSPKCASDTGASMPAAAQVAPFPRSGSTTATSRPDWAERRAIARPMIPPPTTTRS